MRGHSVGQGGCQSNSGSPEGVMLYTSNPRRVSTFTMSGLVRKVLHMCVSGVVNLIVPSIALKCPIGLLRRSQRKGVERGRKMGVATRESTCEQKNLRRWLWQCVRSLSNSWDRNWKQCEGGLRVGYSGSNPIHENSIPLQYCTSQERTWVLAAKFVDGRSNFFLPKGIVAKAKELKEDLRWNLRHGPATRWKSHNVRKCWTEQEPCLGDVTRMSL